MSDSSAGKGLLLCEVCGQKMVMEEVLSAWRSGSSSSGCECGEHSVRSDSSDEGRARGEAGSLTNPLRRPDHPRPGSSLR